jgi:hypothetical protein
MARLLPKFHTDFTQLFVPKDIRDGISTAEEVLEVSAEHCILWETETGVVRFEDIDMSNLPANYEGVTSDVPCVATSLRKGIEIFLNKQQ